MYECTQAKDITKLPKGKHSTKGVGRTYPDPEKSKIVEDGVEVPLGPPVENPDVNSTLLYNEYPFLSIFINILNFCKQPKSCFAVLVIILFYGTIEKLENQIYFP